jgi:hypothetical protein
MDGPAGIYVVADLAGAPRGAIAPLIGGWMMDLFAARHLRSLSNGPVRFTSYRYMCSVSADSISFS